ncbi:MAG: triple tyrosine motif-containing protein [Bacteroidota bacterium]
MHLLFQHLSKDQGLSQSFNSYIFKDSRGFVWISSLDGLNRFDGQRVRVYKPDEEDDTSLTHNMIVSPFFEDVEGNLWFATYNAINCYLRQKDHFMSFYLKDAGGQTIKEDYYVFHLDDQQGLWVRTGLGRSGRLHWFDIKTHRDTIVGPLNGHRCSVVMDTSGQVRQVISAMMPSGGGIELLGFEDGQMGQKQSFFRAPDQPTMHITAVYPEKDSLYWLASDFGLMALNPVTGEHKVYTNEEGIPCGKVWSIAPYAKDAKDSILFVSSLKGGLLIFDQQKRRFTQQFIHEADVETSLRQNVIQELYIDDHDNLWISIWATGVEYTNLKKTKFASFLQRKGSSVLALKEDRQSNIWCGTNRGVMVFNPEMEQRAYFPNDGKGPLGLPDQSFLDIEQLPNGKMIAVCESYLYELNLNPARKERIAKSLNIHHDLFILADQRILLATEGGIMELLETDQGLQIQDFPGLDTLKERPLTAAFQDREGQLYLSENGENLWVYSWDNGQPVLKKRLEGLGYCKAFYEPEEDSIIWIATTKGLVQLHKEDLKKENIGERKGLPQESFYSVQPDQQGNFWLSGNGGLVRYHPERQEFRRFTTSDGLQGAEFNTNAYLARHSGELWFGGANGINVFHPDSIKDLPYPPELQLTQLLINDEAFPLDTPIGELGYLPLHYSENTLSFEFVAMDYSDAQACQYQYRMMGYDKNWVPGDQRGFARYANLPPGDYTFQVKAANSDGIWNEHPRSLRLYVQTPFWRSWWFYLLCLIAISAIIYGWFQYRLQQAIKLERMRVKISSDLHDDVGTLLSGLAMQSELLELTARQDDKPKLQRISEMSRNAMSRMRDTVWAIDARKDKFENLLDRMREHAEETLTPIDIRYSIRSNSVNLKKNIPSNIRQNLYLIYKEAITNIAKHSNANHVDILLDNNARSFQMGIHDNGQVKEKTYKTTGLGMSNMEMRAEQIGASLEVKREDGFRVFLTMEKLA